MEQRPRVDRRSAFVALLAVVALSPQPAGAQPSDAVSAPVAGVMTGSATGQPAEGLVTLIAGHPDSLVETARTLGGMFQFGDVPPGPAVVLARADGFAPYFGELTIEGGEPGDVRIELLPEATMSGVVLDENGCPAPDARVHVGYRRTLPGAGFFSALTRGRTVTRSDGAFTIGGLVPSTPVSLQARRGGRLSDIATVTVEPGMEHSGLVLRLR